MNQNQLFKEYNIFQDINNFNIGDAVKVTSLPQYESFWISINKILDNSILECKIENDLIKEHPFKYEDIIQIKINYIKEHKLKNDRLHTITDEHMILFKERVKQFKDIYKRFPTDEECQILFNINLIQN